MRLRPSDLYAQLLRPVGVYGAEFNLSDVRTRHAALLKFYDTFAASDFYAFDMVSSVFEQVAAADVQLYTFRIGLKDSAPAVDRVAFTFHSGWSDSVSLQERTSIGMVIRFRDSVFAGSGVNISGGPYLGSADYQPVADYMKSFFTVGARSNGVASDSVAVGMRYLIDCFFGGLSFGGSPFGGRIV